MLERGAVLLYNPMAKKIAVISLSWLKSAYRALSNGKVAGLESKVEFVEV